MILAEQEALSRIDDPIAMAEDIRAMKDAIERVKRGDLGADEFKRFRLHRGIYSQRADQVGFNMVRVKIPYGLLTSRQLARLADIAATFADGIAHITTRQDIQFHWVRLENVPTVLERLADVGLTTREACGNTVRNIVGSPLAGVAPEELFDVTPYAQLLAKHLLRNPLNQQLPRKFKISFSGSPNGSDGVIPWIHDIGFVAALDAHNCRGFRVYVGGGLGSQPRVADLLEDFTPVEQLIPTAEAILMIFNKYGNRENRNKARMKFVLWKLGLDGFRTLVFEERKSIITSGRAFPEPEAIAESGYLPLESNGVESPSGDLDFVQWSFSNVSPQKQAGYNVVYVNPTIGDLTTDQLFAIGRLAQKYSNGLVRTTTQQDILFRWIRTCDLLPIYEELKQFNLHQAGAQTIANVTSCPGADTCNLGITHSRALGRALTELFQNNAGWSNALKDLRVKISGCPNSCGQHHVAAIGFYGASRRLNGREIPSYVLLIGGGLNSGKQSFAETVGKIPARKVPEAVSRILRSFLEERTGGETFWSYVDRLGTASFRTRLKDLIDIRQEELENELFIDLGQLAAFKARTGAGECAV